jgi:hypothetical protein
MTPLFIGVAMAFVLMLAGTYSALATTRGALGGFLICAGSAVAVVTGFYLGLRALFA